MKRYLFSLLLVVGCGNGELEKITGVHPNSNPPPSNTNTDAQIKQLQQEVYGLVGNNQQISNLLQSDFATCPNSGDTADALINKICKVAQAANVEQMVAIKEQLATLNESMAEQLTAINNQLANDAAQEQSDIASVNASIASINTQLTTISGEITTLQSQMTSADNAITALQNLTASITTTLNGTMSEIDIGTENANAGPLYESVLRKVDKSRINAYVEAYSSNVSFGLSPIKPSSGTPTVTITKPTTTVTFTVSGSIVNWSANGFAAGDPVMFSSSGTMPTGLTALTVYYVVSPATNTFQVAATQGGTAIAFTTAGTGTITGSLGTAAGDLIHLSNLLGGSAGFSAGDVTGDFTVVSVPDVTTFTLTLRKNATSNTAFGSSGGYMYRVFGRGMATVWQTASGADTAVRTTTLGTKAYNWIVLSSGNICYDKTTATQTFSVINAQGSNIVCK